MYYVTMTDKVLSGWGKADGKIAKFVYECATIEEAEAVKRYADSRDDTKHVNITTKKPSYSKAKYNTEFKNKVDTPFWYKH